MSSSLGILQALAIQESPIRTGWLRRNIKWDAPKASHGRLEARADYSLYVERGVAGTARNPNPFMRRARDKGKSKVEKQFRQAIQKTLKRNEDMSASSITTAIQTSLEAIRDGNKVVFKDILDYATNKFNGFPTITIYSTDMGSEFASSAENLRML